ncbi:MAG: hypothetical protein ACXV3D_05685, partial [Halobacteriota archaeon]
IHVVASPTSAALAATHTTPVETVPQTKLSAVYTGDVFPVAAASYLGTVRFLIAQSEIPDVLVPSVVPPAEPMLPQESPTPQASRVSPNTSNSTTQNTAENGFSLSKIVGSISPFFIIALIPLLFVIGALFYFFFMGDQDRGAPSDEKEADVQFADASEDTGWRELK